MKQILTILFFCWPVFVMGQKIAVKTNIAYWAAATLNIGGGFSYGYQWLLGKHWNLEAELGLGYAYLDYDKYLRNKCGRFINTGHRNYWGPTKLSISFMYLYNIRKK